MSHEWETGFMVRKPSWHRNERAVLTESPRNWEDARRQAGLTWEVTTEPVYGRTEGVTEECEHFLPSDQCETCPTRESHDYAQIEGYRQIKRDDNGGVLAIQPSSYHVIKNEEFGQVINDVVGITDEDDPVVFEALFSLYSGKMIVALLYFEEPLKLEWDPSKTYCYLSMASRHDGNGGLRGIPTNVRVQCANTMNWAEAIDGKRVGFTIRHTSNWEERVAEIARGLQAARGETAKWVEFAEQLALYKVNGRQREAYLKRFLPISDDMGQRQMTNIENSRDSIRRILSGETCAEIANTGYGLLMASTEWADHYRAHQSTDSYIGRQLLNKQAPKVKAASVLRSMARL